MQEYEMPETLDIDWFAVDKMGNIAHFASGGGKLPNSIGTRKKENQMLASIFIDMPKVSAVTTSKIVVQQKLYGKTEKEQQRYLATFAKMSEKGLVSYDKRILGDFDDTEYLQVTIPKMILNVSSLPSYIQTLLVTIYRGDFLSSPIVNLDLVTW